MGSALEQRGQGGKSALLLSSTDEVFSHFLLTFVLLPGSKPFYFQEFIICHEMQQWLGAGVSCMGAQKGGAPLFKLLFSLGGSAALALLLKCFVLL